MRIEVTQQGSIVVALIEGEVDLANGPQFADEVLGNMPDEATALVVDLAPLRYIDSAGVRSLFEIASALSLREQLLAIAVPESSPLRSVLNITRVEDIAAICATRDEALAVVANGRTQT